MINSWKVEAAHRAEHTKTDSKTQSKTDKTARDRVNRRQTGQKRQ